MNGYNFTERVRKVLALAREESASLRHEYVGTEHLLLALIREGEGVGATALRNLNVDFEDLRFVMEQTVKRGTSKWIDGSDLPFTSRAKKVLELAMAHARKLNHKYVGTEHLLLGLIAEQKGIAAQVLESRGVTLDGTTAEVLRILGTLPTEQQERVARGRGAERKPGGFRIQPPTELLVELVRDAETVATEYLSSEAMPVHATVALLRRGEGFAIAIVDRLGCDHEKALRALDVIARKAGQSAASEQGAKLGDHLAEFLREMYQPWKMPLGTLDLLLFVLDKDAEVAAVFSEQGITAARVLDEGQRFSG